MTIRQVPISPIVGVELIGVNTKNPTKDDLRAILDAFNQHYMVLIRDSGIDPDIGVKICELTGRTEIRRAEMAGVKSEIATNNNAFWNGEILFHSDGLFHDKPLRSLALHAQEVASKGGETMFVNGALAYQKMSPELRERIKDLKARNVWKIGMPGDRKLNPDDFTDDMFSAIHPLVWTHPVTGEDVLLASKMFTDKIIGLPREESDALLDEIFAVIERDDVLYMHKWEVGDFLLWDNLALLHARADFDPKEKRSFRRYTVVQAEPLTVV